MNKFLSLIIFVSFWASPLSAQTDTITRPAEFPGGRTEFSKYLHKHFEIPEFSASVFSAARFIVKFKVDTLGKIFDIHVTNSYDSLYTEEITRVLKNMPAWQAAIKNNVKVVYEVTCSIPVKLFEYKAEKVKEYNSEFIRFKYHKSASITAKDSIIRISSSFHKGGSFVIKREDSVFSAEERLKEIQSKFANSSITISGTYSVSIQDYQAQLTIGKLTFNPFANSLTGPMIVKIYQFNRNDNLYSVTIIDAEEDLSKNYSRNYVVMSSLWFSDYHKFD